jgi:hypothetical protein
MRRSTKPISTRETSRTGAQDCHRRLHGRQAQRLWAPRLGRRRRARDSQRGGVVTDDEIRSLAISQRLLGTEEIVLIHHTDCGMLTFSDDGFREAIRAETGIKPPWAAEAFADLDTDVRQSLARIRVSPFIPIKSSVRGFVYDVKGGSLREVSAA